MKQNATRWFSMFGRTLSRRDFLRVGRDVSACIALSSLEMSHAALLRRSRADPFVAGVASGDPLHDSVVLWTRLDASALAGTVRDNIAVAWELASDERFQRVVRKGTAAAPADLGHSVHVEAEGLEPGREYWYRFTAGGESSAVGRTRTLPRPGSVVQSLRFAFASCQNYEHGYFTAYRHMVEDAPELVVHLGDYIYERTFGTDNARAHEGGEVFSLDEYRARYALYRRDADLQAAHALAPWIVTTDDHEVENNYAGAISEDNIPPGQFLLRRAAAYQAYYEFMPLRRASLPRGPDMQLYRTLQIGDLLGLNVLDTRQHRGNQPCGDGMKARCAEALAPDLTFLGDRQEQWLMRGMRESRARWNVLANQTMLAQVARGPQDAPTFPMDQWAGYVHARNRMLQFLTDARIANAVVITGDVHSNWVADLKTDFDDPRAPTIGTELVGTSISSGGDGSTATNAATLARNPHIRHYSNRRGYVLNTVTPARWTAALRTVPFVRQPGAPIGTQATFVIESGKPGAQTG